MKTWTKTINISAPIENVWKLLDGSLADMQKIMPQVIENKPVKVTEEGVGSIYRQKYKEGKRIEAYDVETLEYSNTTDKKILKVGFVLANLFAITTYYELNKINETETSFTYSVTNNALKWFVKLFLLFASDKVVVEFLERVKTVAEAQD